MNLPRLYLQGVPGKVGGASTKILHLIRLLRSHFDITALLPTTSLFKNQDLRHVLEPYGVLYTILKELPKELNGIGLAICDGEFFTSGHAREMKARGLKVVWSNEMMWAFKGEAEAAKEGLIDRVLFVSEFQAKAFEEMYRGVPSFLVGK